MKKTIIILIACLLAACTSTHKRQKDSTYYLNSEDIIRVGVVVPLSGELSPYGISVVRGCEIAAEDINSEGGVLGKKIEIITEDDQCRPEVAVKAASKIVNDGANVIVGHLCSGSTIAANRIYKDSGLMVISPSSCNDSLTLSGKHPNFFRTIGYDDSQAQVIASFAHKNLKARKVALIHDNGDYGSGLLKRVRDHLVELDDLEIALFEAVEKNQSGYSKIVDKIIKKEADLTIWGGYHFDGSKIVNFLHEKQANTIFFGCDGILTDKFISFSGSTSEGVFSTGPINTFDTNSMYKKMAVKYQKKYWEEPGVFTANAYAALQMFASTANKVGSLDLEKLATGIKSTFVETPIGTIKFDNNGDFFYQEDGYAYKNGFGVFLVENGKFKVLKKDYARCSKTEIDDPSVRINEVTGVSVLPPQEKGWQVLERSKTNLVLGKKGPTSSSTYIAIVTLFKLPKLETEYEFLEYISKMKEAQQPKEKFRLIKDKKEMIRGGTNHIIKYHAIAEDKVATAKFGDKTQLLEIIGYTGQHPSNHSIGVDLGYSFRHQAGAEDVNFEEKANAFLDQIIITDL